MVNAQVQGSWNFCVPWAYYTQWPVDHLSSSVPRASWWVHTQCAHNCPYLTWWYMFGRNRFAIFQTKIVKLPISTPPPSLSLLLSFTLPCHSFYASGICFVVSFGDWGVWHRFWLTFFSFHIFDYKYKPKSLINMVFTIRVWLIIQTNNSQAQAQIYAWVL